MFYSSFSLLYFHFIGGWTRFLFRHDFAMQHNIFLAYAKNEASFNTRLIQI